MIASAVAKISQFDNVEQAKEYAAKKAIKSLQTACFYRV